MEKIIQAEKLKTEIVRKNTLGFPNSQSYLNQQEAVIKLLEAERADIVYRCAKAFGIEGAVQVDLANGNIYERKS